jgi:outer membrane receptor protein involved in Fe transport
MYGSEAAMTWQPLDTLRLRGSYSLLRNHFESNADDSVFDGVAFEPGAEHIATLGAIWNVAHNLDFDTYLRFVDTVRGYNGSEGTKVAAARLRLDLRLEWRVTPSWSVELIGQNLFETSQEYTDDDNFSLPARIGPSGTLKLNLNL